MFNHIDGQELSNLVDGQVTPARERKILTHLDECLDCNHEFESLSRVKIQYRSLPSHPAPAGLVYQLKKTYAGSATRRGWTFWWKPVGAFAALALLVSGVFWNRGAADAEFIDLDSLMTAHSRSQADLVVPQADMVRSNFSARLASYYGNEN